jgi:nitroimidazol reductase NimA-like FMN-containing flavoprotein (pyridoxamine 5'-phosphate oxidase superfamily)
VAVLATVRRDGRPVPLPAWYVTLDRSLFFRTPRRSRRVGNIEANPAVSVLIHDGEAWAALRGVLLQTDAEIVTDDDLAHRVRTAFAERFADRLPAAARLPRAMSDHYARDVILRLPIPDHPISWDNHKVRFGDDTERQPNKSR